MIFNFMLWNRISEKLSDSKAIAENLEKYMSNTSFFLNFSIFIVVFV